MAKILILILVSLVLIVAIASSSSVNRTDDSPDRLSTAALIYNHETI